MLDIFLAVFVRGGVRLPGASTATRCATRLAVAVREGWVDDSPYGPVARASAGGGSARASSLGLACGVKWSGVYYIVRVRPADACIWDVTARRAAGVRATRGSARCARDVLPGAVARSSSIPVLVYLAHLVGVVRPARPASTGTLAGSEGRPDGWYVCRTSLRSLWYYARNVLEFHDEPGHVGDATSTRGSPSRGRGRWACGRCSTTTTAVPSGLRRRPRCVERDHADRHARDVVARAAGARLGAVADRSAGMDWRYAARAGRPTRRAPAVVHQPGPADVLLLRHADGAVPGARDHAGRWATSWAGRKAGLRTAGHRSARRGALRRPGGGQLRLAVADPERRSRSPRRRGSNSCGCRPGASRTQSRPALHRSGSTTAANPYQQTA